MGKRRAKHSLAFVVHCLASVETLFAHVLSRETGATVTVARHFSAIISSDICGCSVQDALLTSTGPLMDII